MDIDQYQDEAQNTKSGLFIPPDGESEIDILHAVIGISTEAGELLDPFKKYMFYGKLIDFVNLDEEIGDVLWYIAIYAQARGITISDLCGKNSRKLKHRYPDKFKTKDALNRDLDGERQILEGNTTV